MKPTVATVLVVLVAIASTVSAVGNLRYTFSDDEERPAGFDTVDAPEPARRRTYPACQDGSGGMCVDAGQCPPNLKATPIRKRVACGPGLECCHGPPANSRTPCADRGGECTAPPRSCGTGPQAIRTGTECDHANGEICCIWTF